jgi:hypothetical protein
MIFRGTARAVIVALVAASAHLKSASADEMHIDSAFGVPQTVNGDNHDEVARHMAECNHYMMDVKDKDQDLFGSCKNEHELCTHWALSGECTTNHNEMQEMCGPACKSCDPSVHTALLGDEEDEEDEEELLDETESEDLDETESEGSDEEEEDLSEAGEEEEEDGTDFDEEGEEEDATEFGEEEEDASEFDEEEEGDEVVEWLAVEM